MREEYAQRYRVTVDRLRVIARRLRKHLRPIDVAAALFAVAIEELLTSKTSQWAAQWLRELANDLETSSGAQRDE